VREYADHLELPFELVTTLAGTGRPGFGDGPLRDAYFDHPGESCALGDGSVILADTRNQCLRRIIAHKPSAATTGVPSESTVETLMTNHFLAPRGPVALDGGTAVAVCDSGHHKVRMLQLFGSDPSSAQATPAIRVPLPSVPLGTGPAPLDGSANGPAAAKEMAPARIRWIQDSVVAGCGIKGHVDGPVEAACFDTPTGLCVLRDGSLLVADSRNHAVRRIAARPGKKGLFVTTVIGGGGSGFVDGDSVHGKLNTPTCLAVDRHGTVLVADTGNHAVRALHAPANDLSADGWIVTTLAGGPGPGSVQSHQSFNNRQP
jgi:hypothetical protein